MYRNEQQYFSKNREGVFLQLSISSSPENKYSTAFLINEILL
jgi:hypothetical protein